MHIDSVRELKGLCLRQQVKPLSAHPMAVAALAAPAGPVGAVEAVQRSFALGIAASGAGQFRLAVRIQKRALEGAAQIESMRSQAKGEIDVRYVGRVVKRAAPSLRARRRPLVPGCSIGHFRITAGTLGCFVATAAGAPRILSNNHVLADENRGKKGDAVIQPGRYDGGKAGKDTVGALDRFVRLKKTAPNRVDAALATIADGVRFDAAALAGLGRLAGVAGAPVDVGGEVHKVGRTTATTQGRVTAFELDNVVVEYDAGDLRFDDQLEIEGAGAGPFSNGGDSGSLIVDRDRHAVALLFAGGDQGGSNGKGLTYASSIAAVFAALGVTLHT